MPALVHPCLMVFATIKRHGVGRSTVSPFSTGTHLKICRASVGLGRTTVRYTSEKRGVGLRSRFSRVFGCRRYCVACAICRRLMS